MSKTGNFEVYYTTLQKPHKMIRACVCDTEREAEDVVRYYKKRFPHKFLIVNLITEGKAREFHRDLIGTLNSLMNDFANPRFGNGTSTIISNDYVADLMGISPDKANDFLSVCAKHNLADHHGSNWLIY